MLAGVLAIEGEMVVVVGCWLVLLRRLLRSVEIVVAARLWLSVDGGGGDGSFGGS